MLLYRNPTRGAYSPPVRHLRLSLPIWLCIIMTMACGNDDPVTDVERISGLYVATTFTEPGANDGGVDILANGGMLTARLSSNQKVEGRLLIPGNIGSNFAPIDTSFFGEFNLDGDTVRFSNTQTFLDYDLYMFIVSDTRLETPDWTGHLAVQKIILEKQQ